MTYYKYYGINHTMKPKIVVTNLRIPETDWLQVKTMAAELGMSINEYVNFLIRDCSARRQLATTIKETESIWNLEKLATMKNKPVGQLSQEDETVYG